MHETISREEVSLYKMHYVTMHPAATSKPNLHKPQEMNARRGWKGEEKEKGGHVKAVFPSAEIMPFLYLDFFGAKLILYVNSNFVAIKDFLIKDMYCFK